MADKSRLLTDEEMGYILLSRGSVPGIYLVRKAQDAKTAKLVAEDIMGTLEREYPAITTWPCWPVLKKRYPRG